MALFENQKDKNNANTFFRQNRNNYIVKSFDVICI